jgi:hypothetical protein
MKTPLSTTTNNNNKKKKKKRKKKKKEIPEGLRPGSSGRALVWQAQGPEFNL